MQHRRSFSADASNGTDPSLPPMLGRFRIIGRLGHGGMAEVLLGRLEGAAGFERHVAVKRLLPHFAEDSEIATMFVDEAHVLARLHHPNVVRVEDLVDGDEGVFLVMEHLVGESVAALVRAMISRGMRLSPALAAYIVAEAAAGLHAAHELRDDRGALLHLVHRDVSPSNLFVTDAGVVKVLDFGIARHDGRLGVTRTGDTKGKVAYMAPEQLSAAAVDRRTDVFSLGVVLHELLTFRRLFKRESELATIRAVCAEPIPGPAQIDRSVPPELDAICRLALHRDPDARFGTALHLREALLEHCAPRLGADPGRYLVEVVATVLGPRLEQEAQRRRDAVRAAPSSTPPPRSEESTVAPSSEDSRLAPRSVSAPRAESAPSADGRASWPSRGPSPTTAGAFVIALVSVGAALAWALPRGDGGADAIQASPLPLPPDLEAREPVATAVREPPPMDAPPDPRRTASLVATLPSGAEPPRAMAVDLVVEVSTEPPGASVELDGRERGETPLEILLPRDGATHTLALRRRGYESERVSFEADSDRVVRRTLVRARRADEGRGRAREPELGLREDDDGETREGAGIDATYP